MTPYHGGGVPADRVKLISNVVLEMSLTNKNQGAPGRTVQTNTVGTNKTTLNGAPLFNQLSSGATSSAVGAFSLRAVKGTTAKAVQVTQYTLLEVPPIALTQNTFTATGTYNGVTNGQYVALASSYVSSNDVYRCFDKNTGTRGLTTSADYTVGTGVFVGSASTVDSTSSTYNGAWVQIKIPGAIFPVSYSVSVHSSLTLTAPYTWKLFGSTTGASGSWVVLDTQTAYTFTTATVSFNIATLSGGYTYFRLAANRISPSSTAGNLGPAEIVIYGYSSLVSSTQDFYADRLGNLLTAPVTGQSLANWLGGATGYVTTWYDQSGRGNHFIQTDTAKQPRIVINSGKWNVFFNRDTTPTFYSNLSCVNNITGVKSIVYNFNMSSTFNTYQTLLGQNLNDNGGFRFNNRFITGGNNNRDFLAGTGSYWYLNNNYGSQPTPTNNLYTDNIWNYAIGVCPSTSSAPWTAFAFNSISSPAANLIARATYGYMSEMLIFTSQIGASDAGVLYNTRYQ